ncbi:MAG TPA: hypothetical protein VKD22_12490 [Ramlibacter sp.]|nr:hypothetical protein [Ramlibacter sp.]
MSVVGAGAHRSVGAETLRQGGSNRSRRRGIADLIGGHQGGSQTIGLRLRQDGGPAVRDRRVQSGDGRGGPVCQLLHARVKQQQLTVAAMQPHRGALGDGHSNQQNQRQPSEQAGRDQSHESRPSTAAART